MKSIKYMLWGLYGVITLVGLAYNPYDILGPWPTGNYAGILYWLLLMYYHSGWYVKNVF